MSSRIWAYEIRAGPGIPVTDLHDVVPPETEPGGIMIVPDSFQFLEMRFDAFIVTAGPRISQLINVESVEVGYGLLHEIRVTLLAGSSRQVASLALM